MNRIQKLTALCGLILSLSNRALAGFDSSASNNIAVYWGQNSINRASGGQQRLSFYCADSPINIIPMAFLYEIKNPATTINFANAGDNCTAISGSQILSCPQIEEDIQTCQSAHNKSLLLSIGGATYTEGGFTSPAEAISFAGTVWSMFGPKNSSSSVERPFGEAVIDGFDIDLEAGSQHMIDFVGELRRLMDADTTKKYYLSGAPQCFFPDAAMGDLMDEVPFDFVNVQFYNNDCGVINWRSGGATQDKFNFDIWDKWAKGQSKNKDVRVLLGIPGSAMAGGGYVSGDALRGVIEYSKQFGSFGGVMMWDMSQVYGNAGFLDSISAALGSASQPSGQPISQSLSQSTGQSTSWLSNQPSFVTVTTVVTVNVTNTVFPSELALLATTSTENAIITSALTETLVPQWGRCGGSSYSGATSCVPPYQCVYVGDWWSDCR
ncbi:family 18 putative glycoside hydrolase [Triangularia verruculosa]|uniref:chitinase n=1 Tax=Triangularia verruculosa TaxID=2587418 RepID=A0AAN6XDH6_9PEZI|nr:family 18 putative glycoside hydrolase [Triangularia verruculosa]